MELRSTGNPDTRNQVTMSMLEYLRKKGVEAMGMTNSERIRNMEDEELAKLLVDFNECEVCGQFDKNSGKCNDLSKFICTKGYRELVAYEWLKQPVEE